LRETRQDYIMRSFISCTLQRILWGWPSQWGCDGQDMWHAWERWENHTEFSLENVKRPLRRFGRR